MTDPTEETVKIWCSNCGRRLNMASAAEHPKACRPRWFYWWPRTYPYSFAVIALVLGLLVGRLG